MARRFGLLVVGFALVLLPMSGASQEKQKKDRDEGKKVRDGVVSRVVHLMPPAFAAELKLTAEQSGQVAKIEQEFKDARVKSMMGSVSRIIAIVEDLDDLGEDKEVAPVLALAHEITGGLLESRRLRVHYEKKMCALLNADQQTKFAQLKERRPGLRGEATYHFYPPDGHERLRLTDEQKQKLRALQTDLETKLRDFLTEEQRKIYDQIHPPRKETPNKN